MTDHRDRCKGDGDYRIAELGPATCNLVERCPDGAGPGRSGSALLLPAGDGWEVVAVQSAIGSPGGIVSGIAVVPEGVAPTGERRARARPQSPCSSERHAVPLEPSREAGLVEIAGSDPLNELGRLPLAHVERPAVHP